MSRRWPRRWMRWCTTRNTSQAVRPRRVCFLFSLLSFFTNICRPMARDLYQGQPPPLGICLLHQRQVSRLLFPLFQGRRTRSTSELAGEGDSARLRTTEEPLPRHACSVQRLQADVPEHEQGRPEMSFFFRLYSVLLYFLANFEIFQAKNRGPPPQNWALHGISFLI